MSCMPLIKLRKANETGQEVRVVFVNTDQIATVGVGQNVTELQMGDGRTRWVRDTPEQVVSLAKASV